MTILGCAIQEIRETAIETLLNRTYYEGNHRSTLGRDQKNLSPYRERIEGLRDNLCRGVVDLCVDRLSVTGFATQATGDPVEEALAARAWDIWQANRMSLRSRKWFTSLEVTGEDAVIIVWPDSTGKVRLWLQEPEQVAFEASEEDESILLWVAKRFWDGKRSNVIIYTPEAVETWQSKSPLKDPDEQSYKLVDTVPNPLGRVPAVAVSLDCSDLDVAIPLQDELNMALANGAIAGAYFSLPLRVWLGLESVIDPETGVEKAPFEVGSSRSVFVPPAVDGGQPTSVVDLQGQDPSPFIKLADSMRAAIARSTRTPAHLLLQAGTWPSGEALLTAEGPFVSKVEARQALYGAALADAMGIAVAFDMMLNGVVIAPPAFDTQWKSAASRSDVTDSQVAETLVGLGVPLSVVLQKVMGWDAETAADIEAHANESKAVAAQAAAVAAAPAPVTTVDPNAVVADPSTPGY